MEDMIEVQIVMEETYNKAQIVPRLRQEFEEAGAHLLMEEAGIRDEFGMNMLIQMALHKRASVPTMVGLLNRYALGLLPDQWQASADLLYKAVGAGLVLWDMHTQELVTAVVIGDELQREFDQYQFPLPMVTEPKTLTRNNMTGYETIRGSLILNDNYHENDICLDHLNRMNSIKLCMNPDTVANVQNQFRNHNKRKPGETLPDFEKRVKAFDKFDRTSRDVLDALFTLGNEFYLTHRYDMRGRTYSMGYHVNYQGHDFNKAVVEFAEKELVQL